LIIQGGRSKRLSVVHAALIVPSTLWFGGLAAVLFVDFTTHFYQTDLSFALPKVFPCHDSAVPFAFSLFLRMISDASDALLTTQTLVVGRDAQTVFAGLALSTTVALGIGVVSFH